MKSLEKDRNVRFRLVEEFATALMPFAPAWFRPPKMVTVPPFAPGLPPHLAHSLSDGIDSDRTVADPNLAPDALRPDPPPAPPQPFAFGPAQTSDPSQPSAVTRTTAGGGKRPTSERGKLVLAIVIGTAVGAIAFAVALIVRSRVETRTPAVPATTTPPVLPKAPDPAVTAPTTATPTGDASTTPTPSATTSQHVRRGMGKLDVNLAGAWCTVTIDGAAAGVTPLANYEIAAGPHK